MHEPNIRDVVACVLAQFEQPEIKQKRALVDRWPRVVGQKIASHTKPRFGRNGRLLVWVDDSTLAYELSQRLKRTILKRAQNEFGNENVEDIRFVVGQL